MKAVFEIGRLVREDLKDMEPYDAYYAPGVVRMDGNENPYDFPGEVTEYMENEISRQFFSRYPDPMARELVRELSSYLGVSPDCIMVGNGSDELILNIMLAFGSGGRKVVIASPTFSMYGIHARVAGAKPVLVDRGPDFEVDVRAMIGAADDEPGVIILCNPNNPSGNTTSLDDVEAIAGAVSSLVVVDEAYIEFGGDTCLSLIGRYPNLVVMRTFSKAYSLAGLRVGYLAASPGVVSELLRIKQPFNVNSFSQLAARSVLKFRHLFRERIKMIVADRDILAERMKLIPGIKVYPSVANFILFEAGEDAAGVHRLLKERGVVIRFLSMPGRGDFLRVSVGTTAENEVFLKNLAAIMADRSKFYNDAGNITEMEK
ncbi:MAG: histidinol-phosphate transaminase [Bacillota bacterium]